MITTSTPARWQASSAARLGHREAALGVAEERAALARAGSRRGRCRRSASRHAVRLATVAAMELAARPIGLWTWRQPLAAGIVNVTVDSMFAGARSGTPEQAVADGMALAAAGFEMLDVGAVAAKAGPPVAAEDEAAALVPAIEGLAANAARPVPDSKDARRQARSGRLNRTREGCRSRPTPSRPRWPRARLDAGATVVNDISGGSEEMFELVAERGCGYVLMHIEGPPRVDRPWREYGDVVDHLKAWFEGRVELARELGVARSRSRSTPDSTSTSAPTRTWRSCAGSASCGRWACRSTSRSRARTSSARSLAGSWEERWPAGRARVGDGRRGGPGRARGRRRPPHPRPQLAAGDARRRADLPVARGVTAGATPGRSRSTRRDATGGSSPRAPRASGGRGRSRCRARSTRPSPTRCGRAGIEPLYTPPAAGAARRRRDSNLVITSGTASGKSLAFNLPVLDGIARAARSAAPSTSTRPRRWPRTRRASSPSCGRRACARRSTTATRRRRSGRRSAAATNLVLTNPDMLHVGILPHHKDWGDFLANLELGRRRRGPHLPRRLRLPRRQRAAAAAADGPRLRRRAALPARLGDDRQPGRAGRAAWSGRRSS